MTTTPQPQVWPALRAKDAHGLIAFLTEAFGFEKTVVHAEGDTVQHAQLAWPEGGGIMLGSVRHTPDDPFPLTPGTFGAYVVTSDPDTLYTRAIKAGATVTRELHETDYGSRDFIVRDPEGNLWSFGTYRGEPHGTCPPSPARSRSRRRSRTRSRSRSRSRSRWPWPVVRGSSSVRGGAGCGVRTGGCPRPAGSVLLGAGARARGVSGGYARFRQWFAAWWAGGRGGRRGPSGGVWGWYRVVM